MKNKEVYKMNKFANFIVYTLGIGALGGSLWGAALIVDKLLGIFAH